MRQTSLLFLLAACGGHAAPTAPAALSPGSPVVETEPGCVERYVQALELPHLMSVEPRYRLPADGSIGTIYVAGYGEAQDCESGCFHSKALLLARGCDRLGWIAVHDYDDVADRFERYRLEPADAPLYEPALWDDLRARERDFFRDDFLIWLERDPAAPPEVRARAAEEQRR